MTEEKDKRDPQDPAGSGPVKSKKKRSLFRKIVNVFLYTVIGFLVLFLLVFGFTQTSAFRELLRDKIVEIANDELNGKLQIERIDGTIFTSLILRNTTLITDNDTLLRAEFIGVKTSPLQLLLKKIFVRNFEIKNADIFLAEDSTGTLNISKLLPPSEPDTTAASEFPFLIQVADFKLSNIDFTLQNFSSRGNDNIHDKFNTEDLRIRNLNLGLSLAADINENNFQAGIANLSFKSNIKSLSVKEFSGLFSVNENDIRVEDFKIKTAASEININAKMQGYNLFDTTGSSVIEKAPLELELDAERFSFSDLAPFLSENILGGSLKTEISASGTLRELDLSLLRVELENSNLEFSGRIRNVTDPASMFAVADFRDTYIHQGDIKRLLPGLEIPEYHEYGILIFDTLYYEGGIGKFRTNLHLTTDKGEVSLNGNINLEREPLEYDAVFSTEDFDLSPLAGIAAVVTSSGKVNGKGTDPQNMEAQLSFSAGGSVVEGIRIDTLFLSADAVNKNIIYDLNLDSDTTGIDFSGNLDFTDSDNPLYEINGSVRNLNLAQFMDDTLETDLNVSMDASGSSFDLDKMNLFLSMKIYESLIDGMRIDSTRAIIDLQKPNGDERVVNLISDLADITLKGDFTISETIELVSNEAELLSAVFSEKINQYIPGDSLLQEKPEEKIVAVSAPARFQRDVNNLHMNYLIDLKDFRFLSFFLGENRVEIDGELSGFLESSSDSVYITLNTDLGYVKYWGPDDVYFLSGLDLNLDVANSFNAVSSADIFTDLSLSAGRIFAGTEIYDLTFDLNINENKAAVDFASKLEDYAAALSGTIDLSANNLSFEGDSLKFAYQHLNIRNTGLFGLTYSDERIEIRNLNLTDGRGELHVDGFLSKTGSQNLKISLNGFNIKDLSTDLLGIRPENSPESEINLSSAITGNLGQPLVSLSLNLQDIRYKNKNFGKLEGNFNYKNKNLDIDIKFIDSLFNPSEPALKITGQYPLNLSSDGEENQSLSNKMNLRLLAENFNLGAFGDVLPVVNQLNGNLSADLKISGTTEEFRPEGFLKLEDTYFIAESNNLEYLTNLSLRINGSELILDSLSVANTGNTEDGGRMVASGTAALDNFQIVSSRLSLAGDLKVLGEESINASPSVYGDLVIATRGSIDVEMNEERIFLKVPVRIRRADLTFPPTASGYENVSDVFIYKYAYDSAAVIPAMDLDSLVSLSRQREAKTETTAKKELLEYQLDIQVEREATINFVLAKELDQNLTAVLKGDLHYENIGGKTTARGELRLLPGSSLQFLKTWEASGSISFENDLANPILDIVATYIDFYYPASGPDAGQEVEVAVKMKLQGALSDLDKILTKGTDNLQVYYGASNIEKNQASEQYDETDAVMFMLLGKFNDNATQQDRDAVASQAAGLAGSVLGGFINSQVGDIVRDVELRQGANEETKITVIGRAGNFRYEIGTSTDVYQDLSKANVKIEYPFFSRLYFRIERKESITTESRFQQEMINEIGVKYRFEF